MKYQNSIITLKKARHSVYHGVKDCAIAPSKFQRSRTSFMLEPLGECEKQKKGR